MREGARYLDAGALGNEVAAQLCVLCSNPDRANGGCREQTLALLDDLHMQRGSCRAFAPRATLVNRQALTQKVDAAQGSNSTTLAFPQLTLSHSFW